MLVVPMATKLRVLAVEVSTSAILAPPGLRQGQRRRLRRGLRRRLCEMLLPSLLRLWWSGGVRGRCVHRLGSLPVLRRRRYETCLASFVCKGWPCSPSAAAGCGEENLLGLPSVRLASLLLFFSVLDAAVLDLLDGVAADALRCGWVVFGERKDQIDESDS